MLNIQKDNYVIDFVCLQYIITLNISKTFIYNDPICLTKLSPIIKNILTLKKKKKLMTLACDPFSGGFKYNFFQNPIPIDPNREKKKQSEKQNRQVNFVKYCMLGAKYVIVKLTSLNISRLCISRIAPSLPFIGRKERERHVFC